MPHQFMKRGRRTPKHPRPARYFTDDGVRLPFSLTKEHKFSDGGGDIVLRTSARDPYLTEREMFNSCVHRPADHFTKDYVTHTAFMPKRNRNPRGALSVDVFYSFCLEFDAYQGMLIHRNSNLPVCQHNAYTTFRYFARLISTDFVAGPDNSAKRFIEMIQQRSGFYFIDAQIYAAYLVNGAHTITWPSLHG
ncbi:hypothetical protein AAF712_013074 [Marasmius tenuissimus]|uniref:Uncharacterized protein n=1 Tax=Marasmius tenuissimus TaxID=585030 RepID=A0ABR2ZFT4_9AGAR